MLTYDLTDLGKPLYESLYRHIKEDIKTGTLSAHEKLPSKRALARNLGISVVTVENAYEQLIGEGYLYALEKKGYFVAELNGMNAPAPVNSSLNGMLAPASVNTDGNQTQQTQVTFNFSSNHTEPGNFPFSIWARLLRDTITNREQELLVTSPSGGTWALRQAIAQHLASFRGMEVDPAQIVVGAGTEYLYGLLIRLLGTDRTYCIENPGYRKLSQVYESNLVHCALAGLDEKGIRVEDIRKHQADIVHISPNHHFPTGITMPVSRRYELLSWANETPGRYIIEDDYDSEFRLNGKPIPTLFSIDNGEKVIYMNTFSKSLSSTIRISYMVLPPHLTHSFYEKLSFYSCTVSTFEQYTLASFISQGYLEKHINRMRRHYGKKRSAILDVIRNLCPEPRCRVIENDSGLHFLLEFMTNLTDKELEARLLERGIKISAITDFDMSPQTTDQHQFILSYSNMDPEQLKQALVQVNQVLEEN